MSERDGAVVCQLDPDGFCVIHGSEWHDGYAAAETDALAAAPAPPALDEPRPGWPGRVSATWPPTVDPDEDAQPDTYTDGRPIYSTPPALDVERLAIRLHEAGREGLWPHGTTRYVAGECNVCYDLAARLAAQQDAP